LTASIFSNELTAHQHCFDQLAQIKKQVDAVGHKMAEVITSGGKILVCGNGGSAADAQHFAAEVVGRLATDRPAAPAIALTTDSSILTAIANDYGFDTVFARQVAALAHPGDALIGISTSGNSPNVINAVDQARVLHCYTIALTGNSGGILAPAAHAAVTVPSNSTQRIQEAHIFILHCWAMAVEQALLALKTGPRP